MLKSLVVNLWSTNSLKEDSSILMSANTQTTARARQLPAVPAKSDQKVLVLLAAYNGAPWIAEQIESVLRQDDIAIDLLICDDGSSDETPSKIAHYVNDPRVRVSTNETRSGSAAQNFFSMIRITSSAGYTHVAFCDQDDIWSKEKLKRACSRLDLTQANALSSAVTAFWVTGREKVLLQEPQLTMSDFLFEGGGQGCTFVLTSSFYEQVREFLSTNRELTQHIHYHDWAIYALARCWMKVWVFDPVSSMRYRQHELNDTGARSGIVGAIRRLRQIKSGWYARQLEYIAVLCTSAEATFPRVQQWNNIRSLGRGMRRRLLVAKFCLTGGRRRFADNAVLIAAALLGWI